MWANRAAACPPPKLRTQRRFRIPSDGLRAFAGACWRSKVREPLGEQFRLKDDPQRSLPPADGTTDAPARAEGGERLCHICASASDDATGRQERPGTCVAHYPADDSAGGLPGDSADGGGGVPHGTGPQSACVAVHGAQDAPAGGSGAAAGWAGAVNLEDAKLWRRERHLHARPGERAGGSWPRRHRI